MNFKIVGSIVLVVALTVAVMFAINKNTLGTMATAKNKSPAFLRCEQLVQQIKALQVCEQKWNLFKEQFADCAGFPPTEPDATQLETSTFRDVIFHIGECFSNNNKTEQALEVYNHGLQFQDWQQDDNFNSYSAHFLLNRAKDMIQPAKNEECFDRNSFEKQLKKFLNSANPEDLRVLLYSENVLDTQVMASDAGGYLTYEQWKTVFEENKSQYHLKYLKQTGTLQNCFISTGWEPDYPWRGFCAEKRGPKGCYYLMTIYAGIEATLEDFEKFKNAEEAPL